HWSTSKTPSYTKSVSWQHHPGLDIDALKIVSQGVNALRDGKRAFIIVTHYQRILDYIKPDYVHVLYQGRIVKSGDFSLVKQLEEQGYGWLTEQQ
ncbi:hypothetical protein ACVT1T_14315, partial [Klebsiella pneumoniae]